MGMEGQSGPERINTANDPIGETKPRPENAVERATLEKKLKAFEVKLFLADNNVAAEEMEQYETAKREYANMYLNGIEPERLLTSIDELKRALAEVAPPKSFEDDIQMVQERNRRLIEEDKQHEEGYKRDPEDSSHAGY